MKTITYAECQDGYYEIYGAQTLLELKNQIKEEIHFAYQREYDDNGKVIKQINLMEPK